MKIHKRYAYSGSFAWTITIEMRICFCRNNFYDKIIFVYNILKDPEAGHMYIKMPNIKRNITKHYKRLFKHDKRCGYDPL